MKKLKLNLQQLDGVEVLTRSQLKQILGGEEESGSGGCRDHSQCGYLQVCTIIGYGTPGAYGKCCSSADFRDCNSACSGSYCN